MGERVLRETTPGISNLIAAEQFRNQPLMIVPGFDADKPWGDTAAAASLFRRLSEALPEPFPDRQVGEVFLLSWLNRGNGRSLIEGTPYSTADYFAFWHAVPPEQRKALQLFNCGWMVSDIRNYPIEPLFIKVLFARDMLSLQVHDEDHYEVRGDTSVFVSGKTEAWVSLQDGSRVFAGFRPDKAEQFLRDLPSLRGKRIDIDLLSFYLQEHKLNYYEGILISPGTVHAIQPDSRIFEVQQPNNQTIKILDPHGRPTEFAPEHNERHRLLVQKHFGQRPVKIQPDADGNYPFDTPYFATRLWQGRGSFRIEDAGSFSAFLCTGACTVEVEDSVARQVRSFDSGDVVLFSADHVVDYEGEGLVSFLPERFSQRPVL